jgi:hypothetical protein
MSNVAKYDEILHVESLDSRDIFPLLMHRCSMVFQKEVQVKQMESRPHNHVP